MAESSRVQRLHQPHGQGIARGGAVQGQGGDAVLIVAEQDIGHNGDV